VLIRSEEFLLILGVLALAFIFTPNGLAQENKLEPLPTDPKQRIYYGEYYDPQRYEACRKKVVAEGNPRSTLCEIFAEKLEPLDPSKRDHFGEFYDPAKFHECRADVEKNDTQCDYLKLKRRPEPEYWPYAGKVPPPKWPDAPKQSVYRKGMTSKEYFDALCKAEAGEFIYRTIENVEGIYQIRPRVRLTGYELRDRFVLEDPYDYSDAEVEQAAFRYVGPDGYQFFESPRVTPARPSYDLKYYDVSFFVDPPAAAQLERYTLQPRSDSKVWGGVKKEFDTAIKSRYGYSWREVKRPLDRELGVVGGELIVVDLTTNEVLGFRRGFAHSGYVRNVKGGFQWEIAQMCPSAPNWTGGDLAPRFVKKVLTPAVKLQGGSDGKK
jgi:hypothetical protein